MNLFYFQEAETLQELKMKEYNKLVLNVGAQQLADIFKVFSPPQKKEKSYFKPDLPI